MKFLTALNLFLLLLVLSCKEGEVVVPYCEPLRSNLIEINVIAVQSVLDSLLFDLPPDPVSEDPLGHHHNLETFVHGLNADCNLGASIVCYACIETFPVMSEVRVTVDSAGVDIYRVIDILTPGSEVMSVHNVHF